MAQKPHSSKTAKSEAQLEAADTSVAEDDAAEDGAADDAKISLNKKAFLERVQGTVGGKRKEVRDVVEATLAALGDALSKGESLVLPPLGRLRVSRQQSVGEGEMLTVRLRRGQGGAKSEAAPKEGLEVVQE